MTKGVQGSLKFQSTAHRNILAGATSTPSYPLYFARSMLGIEWGGGWGGGVKFHFWTNFTSRLTLIGSTLKKFRPQEDPTLLWI